MQQKNLKYLRDVVIPHLRTMPTVEEWKDSDGGLPHSSAILDFDTYQEVGHKTGNPISAAYNCGLEGCLAGWYRWMAIQDKHIETVDLPDFNYEQLGDHFGIYEHEARSLFESAGDGIEQDRHIDTRKILEARANYIDQLLAE